VHDVTAFKSNGIVDGLVNNVAAANISESEKTPDPVKALVWHGASLLLVGTEQGKSSASVLRGVSLPEPVCRALGVTGCQ
jgi:hypothetical protein